MKHLLGILLIGLTTNVIAMKKDKEYKEVLMTKTSPAINVSTDKLWEIIGPGFADAGLWSTAIDYSEGSGEAEFEGATCSERACELNASGFDQVGEKITKYNAQTKEVSYKVLHGMPGFVTFAENNWIVVDLGNNQSALKMSLTMHMKKFMGALMGGMMSKKLDKLFDLLFNDLTVFAETGKVSTEKAERIAKLAKKNVQKVAA